MPQHLLLRAIWVKLLVLTLASYFAIETLEPSLMTIGFVVACGIAGLKILLILHYFMELEHAPNMLQIITYGWVIVLCLLIMLMPEISLLMEDLGLQIPLTE